jgi:hypothetical protein
MIYKIFPSKDTTIRSDKPNSNYGKDEILDLFKNESGEARILLKFNEIDFVLDKIGDNDYDVFLNLYNTGKERTNSDSVQIQCAALSGSWINGVGKQIDPQSTGVNWVYSDGLNIFTSSLGTHTTSSYGSVVGGGSWYTSSLFVVNEVKGLYDDLDLNINVSSIIKHSHTIPHGHQVSRDGFIIRTLTDDTELSYFSRDTHTIYSPTLEFRWDDSFYMSGSFSLVSSLNDLKISCLDLNSTYDNDSTILIRLSTLPVVKPRLFRTSLNNNSKLNLPPTSYYGIKDIKTGEMVIGFNEYTKISCDGVFNFFKINLNFLYPGRYYEVLVKVDINNQSRIFNTEQYFKVI